VADEAVEHGVALRGESVPVWRIEGHIYSLKKILREKSRMQKQAGEAAGGRAEGGVAVCADGGGRQAEASTIGQTGLKKTSGGLARRHSDEDPEL
jgi:hypothetical protein